MLYLVHMRHKGIHEPRIILKDVKILLIQLDMKPAGLAAQLGCSRVSIYHALHYRNRPGVLKKIEKWYEENKGRAA